MWWFYFLLGILALGGAFACGTLVESRLRRSGQQKQISQLLEGAAYSEVRYFQVLCRELANELIHRDPERFAELIEEIVMEVREIQGLSKEDIIVRLASLHQHYRYSNFDIVGTKNYVLYEQALQLDGNIRIEKHYRDIQVWCALKAASDDAWKRACTEENIPTESTLEKVQNYTQQHKDTMLLFKIQAAERDYMLHSSFFPIDERNEIVYRNKDFEVRRLPCGPPSVAYSVRVTSTGELGGWKAAYGLGIDPTPVEYFSLESASLSADDGRRLREQGPIRMHLPSWLL